MTTDEVLIFLAKKGRRVEICPQVYSDGGIQWGVRIWRDAWTHANEDCRVCYGPESMSLAEALLSADKCFDN